MLTRLQQRRSALSYNGIGGVRSCQQRQLTGQDGDKGTRLAIRCHALRDDAVTAMYTQWPRRGVVLNSATDTKT